MKDQRPTLRLGPAFRQGPEVPSHGARLRRRMALVVVAAMAVPVLAQPGGALPFRLVGNEALALERIASSDVAGLYLGREVSLETPIDLQPVDLPVDDAARRSFSQSVLGREPAQVASYWQRRIFEGGGVPPAQLGTPAEVLEHIASHPGGLGYVPAETSLPTGVREIPVFFFGVDTSKVSGPAPEYPPMARRARAEGTVKLRVWIDARGEVVGVDILEGGSFGLGEAAKTAVQRWRYEPARIDGEPVPAVLLLPIDFRF